MQVPASPPPPPGSIASLPLDILAAIVGLLPLRPRLAVVALVSKRFLHAVRHTVRAGIDEKDDVFVLPLLNPRAFPSLTNLTSLHVDAALLAALPPPEHLARVRSLNIAFFDRRAFSLSDHISSLTSLTLSGLAEPYLLRFLARHAETLTSLTLNVTTLKRTNDVTITMPHLTSLVAGEAITYVRAPALKHLAAWATIDTQPLLESATGLITTTLTSLRLHVLTSHASVLFDRIASLTHLTHLDLVLPNVATHSADLVDLVTRAPSLTTLRYDTMISDAEELIEALARQTALRALQPNPFTAAHIQAVGQRLTELSLQRRPDAGALAQHVTNLRKLHLTNLSPIDVLTPEWRLPQLSELLLTSTGDWLPRTVASLPTLIHRYPSLRRIVVTVSREEANVAGLADLFAHCARQAPDVCIYFRHTGLESVAFATHVARLSRQYPWLSIAYAK